MRREPSAAAAPAHAEAPLLSAAKEAQPDAARESIVVRGVDWDGLWKLWFCSQQCISPQQPEALREAAAADGADKKGAAKKEKSVESDAPRGEDKRAAKDNELHALFKKLPKKEEVKAAKKRSRKARPRPVAVCQPLLASECLRCAVREGGGGVCRAVGRLGGTAKRACSLRDDDDSLPP